MASAAKAMVRYWRFMKAMAPSLTASEISTMRASPVLALRMLWTRTAAAARGSRPARGASTRGIMAMGSRLEMVRGMARRGKAGNGGSGGRKGRRRLRGLRAGLEAGLEVVDGLAERAAV